MAGKKGRVVFYFEAEDRGGVSNTISNILRYIHADFSILVVLRDTPSIRRWMDDLRDLDVEFTTSALRNRHDLFGWFDLPNMVRLARVFRGAGVVNFHQHTTFSCLPAIFLARLMGAGAIITTEQYVTQLKHVRRRKRGALVSLIRELRLAVLMFIKKLSLNRIDRIVNVSNANRDYLLSIFPRLDPARVEMIWNGILVENYRLPGGVIAGIDDSRLADPDSVIVSVVASLGNQKGHVHLIEAIPGIHRRFPAVVFLFVGDGHMRGEFERLTRENGSAEAVIFTGYRDDIPGILASSDLFVLPSIFEGTPLAILEAMAAGRAVVATAVDGNAEAVLDGETGYLVPPKDAGALAAKISVLLDRKDLREQFGRRGRERAEQYFSARTMAAAYRELFSRFT